MYDLLDPIAISQAPWSSALLLTEPSHCSLSSGAAILQGEAIFQVQGQIFVVEADH